MSKDTAILARLRGALIPPTAFSYTLATLRQAKLAEKLSAREFREAKGLVNYIVRVAVGKQAQLVVRVCSVVAKELVLLSVPVRYTLLSELIRLGRGTTEYDGVGSGYIVIGDLGENTQFWSKAEWDDAQAYLLHHVRRGGGLVLGDTGVIEGGWFNADFIEALVDFEEVQG